MKLKDIKVGKNAESIKIKFVEVGEVKTTEKSGKKYQCCSVINSEGDGNPHRMDFWEEQVNKFVVGDHAELINFFVKQVPNYKETEGKPITIIMQGYYGKIKKIEGETKK